MAKAKWEQIADLMYKYFSLNEDFGRDEVEGIAEVHGLSTGKIRGNTWKALFTNEVLIETSDGLYALLPRTLKEKKSSPKSKAKSNQLSITKKNNQYYGQYIEEAVVAIINNQPIVNNVKDFTFQEWEIKIINEDAAVIAAYLNASSAEYMGRHTSLASCDIIADNKEIELKYSTDNGTYYNTSVTYFDQFGLIPFKQYMIDYGVLSFLATYFGNKVYDNISPVSKNESSDWRKENPEAYEQLITIEAKARDAYVTQVFEYLTKDESRIKYFAQQMLTKESSGKHTPDSVIIYHHNTDELIEFTKDEILAMANSPMIRSGYTFKFNGFHTTIAWQNGTGLNNPTIRVYLDKKGK